MVSALVARGLAFDHPGVPRVVDGVDLDLAQGELALVIGPNGAGKTTLFGLLGGVLRPARGTVEVLGRPLAGLRPKERARLVAWVPQGLPVVPDVRVSDFVLGGRYPFRTAFGSGHTAFGSGRTAFGSGHTAFGSGHTAFGSGHTAFGSGHTAFGSGHAAAGSDRGGGRAGDGEAVRAALAEADVAELGGRRLGELSGGQLQRVLVARALAQEAPLLLCDEPTASLDPEHQVRVLELVAGLVARGRTALVATHDLSLAARYADRIVVLHRGRKLADGPPAEVLRPAVLEPVFGPDLAFLPGPDAGAGAPPVVLPWPRGARG